MGHIADLSIDKVNIKPNAIAGIDLETTAPGPGAPVYVLAENPRAFPVDIAVGLTINYLGPASDSFANFTFTLKRYGDGTVLYSETIARGGATGGNVVSTAVNFAATDQFAGASEWYELAVSISTGGTGGGITATVTASSFICEWLKR